MHRVLPVLPVLAALLFTFGCIEMEKNAAARAGSTSEAAPQVAVANDNRASAGALRDGVLELRLEARPTTWGGEGPDSILTVLGFAEEGGPVTIPGPLLRVPQGTEVRVSVRNSIPDSVSIGLPGPAFREEGMSSIAGPVLIVHGLRAGTVPDDTLHVQRGEVREVRYRADTPGTYLYRGSPSDREIAAWTGPDAQLAGAIVVDPAGARPDPDERIFVITMLDAFPDTTVSPPGEDVFRRAINGLSWPNTERLRYAIGDTVRWRWVNGSGEVHPMHLHGFHFRVLTKGDGLTDTIYTADATRFAVTEHMERGSTFRMEWVPTRAGNWIFHCHILDHIEPWPARDEATRAHDERDVMQHALDAMGGLVLGISVTDTAAAVVDAPPRQRLRLIAQEPYAGSDSILRGFVLQDGAEPPPDSVVVPGPPLILTRDETTEITVVNRLRGPTTVHWHGMELEAVYDGVAGWSQTGSRVAPLVAPGDSFIVSITPPRAGTFIYHTHMDELGELVMGMYGPLLVLEPGESFDPDLDRIFTIGGQSDGPYPVTINAKLDPEPVTFRRGTEYRLRFINITRGVVADITLERDSVPLRWRALAKDGADLPPALRLEGPARVRTDVGETYGFAWTPAEAGDATLRVRYDQFFTKRDVVLRQIFRVR